MAQSQSQSQQHNRNKSGESDSNITASNSSSTPIAVASKSKKEKESASDLSESPEAPSTSMSHSDSEEGESSEFVEGMFDVIECYDAESKQKKFGFKKRRPPKDPKYETATIVSAIPEITIMRRSVDDDWLFLASDGFYDLFTSKQAGLTVNKHLQRNARDRLSETSKALCSEAALLGSEDDITGILILLGQPKVSAPAPASAPANPTISESPEIEEE
jgi:serine/threonine protein phosphatase PrpC